ncbi:MAG: type 1 glutamine amidotransferase [Flavobacteriales bacterium]
MNRLRVAVLDLYAGHPNQGMRCINELVAKFSSDFEVNIDYKIFDVRGKAEVADLSYHVYISTGGPGSPLESEGSEWEKRYFSLMDSVLEHNRYAPQEEKKHVFLICHSFQIFCRYYDLGQVCKRRSTSFGVMPVHKTKHGLKESFFKGLANPFWAVDSRDWQVINPKHENIEAMGGHVLAIEKFRPHIDLDRCVMAIRFNNEIFGTQFHPEADPEGMLVYMQTDEKKANVIEQHGETKYYSMLEQLNDPDKIVLTYNTIIPLFLRHAFKSLLYVSK